MRYCGIRRYSHPCDHISHFPLRERKALSKILDSNIESDHLQLLSNHLKVPVEHEDSESGSVSQRELLFSARIEVRGLTMYILNTSIHLVLS